MNTTYLLTRTGYLNGHTITDTLPPEYSAKHEAERAAQILNMGSDNYTYVVVCKVGR